MSIPPLNDIIALWVDPLTVCVAVDRRWLPKPRRNILKAEFVCLWMLGGLLLLYLLSHPLYLKKVSSSSHAGLHPCTRPHPGWSVLNRNTSPNNPINTQTAINDHESINRNRFTPVSPELLNGSNRSNTNIGDNAEGLECQIYDDEEPLMHLDNPEEAWRAGLTLEEQCQLEWELELLDLG